MSAHVRRHWILLKVLASIHYVPCWYDSCGNGFVIRRSNLAALGAGVCVSGCYYYHDFFWQRRFLSAMAPFTLGVTVIELFTFSTIPLAMLLNGIVQRHRITQLLNVLFGDDLLLDSYDTEDRTGCSYYCIFVKLLFVAMAVSAGSSSFNYSTFMLTVFTFSILVRCLSMLSYLFIYHLCVTRIKIRMIQLHNLFRQQEHHIERHLDYFFKRFELYSEQIEQINRCLTPPIMLMFVLVLVELSYSAYEWFYLITLGHPDDENFDNMTEWTNSQFWQILYVNMLVLVVPCCESTWTEVRSVEETARCTRYFDDYRLQNTRAAKQVQKFLLKNLHQKKKFSACGFFDIDNTVIYMVFSSIVTYLVILIQFKQLENDLTQPVPYNGTANGTTEAP
uniref:Gustatory receptor n=1 Tax=Anopheles albimanus TaxID=7167 RepID=A0A1Y9G889_ANOAL